MKNSTIQFDIDLVYLWVDGSDLEWVAKRNKFIGISTPENSEATTKGRIADNGELKYSLRSAQMNVPWIRKIFIVTDGQTPKWLNQEKHLA